jgi:hypothetical protein
MQFGCKLLKKEYLRLILFLTLPFFVYIALKTLVYTISSFQNHSLSLGKILFCVVIFILSIVLRGLRTQYLVSKYANVAFLEHLKAISVGYYFDFLLPFRLGQILRAYYFSRKTQLSFGFSFLAILIEKTVDVVLLISTLVAVFVFSGEQSLSFNTTAIISTFSVISLFGIVTLAIIQSPLYLKFISFLSGKMSETFATQFKHSIWSATFVLQKVSKDFYFWTKYLALALAGWILYLFGLFIYYSDFSDPRNTIVSSLTLNLNGGFDFVSEKFLASQGVALLLTYIIISVLGSVSLVNFIKNPKNLTFGYSRYFFDVHKDPSYLDRKGFIGNYFSNNPLYIGIHNDLIQERFEIVGYFKGGSDAITLLLKKDNSTFVRKFVALEKQFRLKSQFNWLCQHQSDSFVRVLGDGASEHYYFYDMEFLANHESFFNLIHRLPVDLSKNVLEQVFMTLEKEVYSTSALREDRDNFFIYLEKCFFTRIATAAKLDMRVLEFLSAENVFINGKSYEGALLLMDRILGDSATVSKLAHITPSKSIHGDLTVDNILLAKDSTSVLIDPSDDNEFTGLVIDVARMLQSLRFGYEFLTRSKEDLVFEAHSSSVSLVFTNYRSKEYEDLEDFFTEKLVPRLLHHSEIDNLYFHVAILYFRMINHQLRIAPQLGLKYLAIGTIALNEYYGERF